MLIGGGVHAVEGLSIGTITDALQLGVVDVTVLGTGADRNVRLTLTPRKEH
jgi:diaminohydroxyphosphoribosylaminopyrimidine deaminase/5-amino-6-(5-phosphoribosylamino)uracil reductase